MSSTQKIVIANKCHDIQVSMGNKNIPEYDTILEIGMMVRLSLDIRGLPQIDYNVLKLVADHYLQIPSTTLKLIVNNLAKIDFIKIDQEGSTIKSILPTVPYFDDIYENIGDFATSENQLSEPEKIAINILEKLTESPIHKANLYEIGAEKKVINRTLKLGNEGGFLLEKRARGKDIVLSPTYIMDNAELYVDLVAKSGANQVRKINSLLEKSQGWPLKIIEQQQEINGTKISEDDILMLKRLAQDGVVKPPSIITPHAGQNYFMFTPTPGNVRLHPGKKEIYERALAMVSSVRLGQLLPEKYAIRSPHLLLSSFRQKGYLSANTEAVNQYKQLTIMRMCKLESCGGNWKKLILIDIPENKEALDIAISLVSTSVTHGTEIDENVRIALQKDMQYLESRLAACKLRETETVSLSKEQQDEIDNLFLKGVI
jgi:hypothetical protein